MIRFEPGSHGSVGETEIYRSVKSLLKTDNPKSFSNAIWKRIRKFCVMISDPKILTQTLRHNLSITK